MTNILKKRFVINIDEVTHKEIKMRAHKKNLSITDYILQALAQRIVREDQYDIQNKNIEH